MSRNTLFQKKSLYSCFIGIIVFTILLSCIPLANAQDEVAQGCCKISKGLVGTAEEAYNWDEEECTAYGETHIGDRGIFHEGEETLDGKTCVAKKTEEETKKVLPKISNPINPKLSVSIPLFTGFQKISCTDEECTVPWIGDYINGLYKYGTTSIVILAVIVLMIAGVMWITAGGKEERIADAKQWIAGSLFGVLIALSSYIILQVINPALTELSPIKISYIGEEDLEPMAETPTNDVTAGTIQSKGQECFLNTFGNSNAAVTKNMVGVNLFGKTVQVHKLAKDAFEKVSREVTGKTNYKFYSMGTQNWRSNVNNSSKLSLHSFGIAIDINPDQNPNYRSKVKPCKTDMPASVINAFKANGFRWGGDYRTICDAMHFEWLGPCQK